MHDKIASYHNHMFYRNTTGKLTIWLIPLTLIGQVHTQVDIIKPTRMYLEGYITKLETLTHNLPCVSLPICNSTSAAQCSKQNSMFLLYYSIKSWDQKVSTLQHRQSTLLRRCCKKLETKGSPQTQHRAATWCRRCDSTASLYIRWRRRTASPICQRAARRRRIHL